MPLLKDYISEVNKTKKVLSVYLTAGYPEKSSFTKLALDVLNYSDMIELGMPFSDPLADGPIIQQSSNLAIGNGITTKCVLKYCSEIKKESDKPVILMGYANTILRYGVKQFAKDAENAGACGVIVPDIPLEEYNDFFSSDFTGLNTIMLTTPTSSENRITEIDSKSSGFIYCVSFTSTTGSSKTFDEEIIKNLERTYKLVKNKMLIGFGIKCKEDISKIYNYADGFIVGSAVVKRLESDNSEGYKDTLNFIAELNLTCSKKT